MDVCTSTIYVYISGISTDKAMMILEEEIAKSNSNLYINLLGDTGCSPRGGTGGEYAEDALAGEYEDDGLAFPNGQAPFSEIAGVAGAAGWEVEREKARATHKEKENDRERERGRDDERRVQRSSEEWRRGRGCERRVRERRSAGSTCQRT